MGRSLGVRVLVGSIPTTLTKVWLNLVKRSVRVREIVGSNPATLTTWRMISAGPGVAWKANGTARCGFRVLRPPLRWKNNWVGPRPVSKAVRGCKPVGIETSFFR